MRSTSVGLPLLLLVCFWPTASGHPIRPLVGRVATREEIRQEDLTVLPDGTGLPVGRGSVTDGAIIYRQECAVCHGTNGEGLKLGPRLVGGIGSLASDHPIKTIGSYWPYATSVWDYIHRAMPYFRPGTLSPDKTYAVTAFLLFRNGIVSRGEVLSEKNLAAVRMPNRNGFVPDPRPDVVKDRKRSSVCRLVDCPEGKTNRPTGGL